MRISDWSSDVCSSDLALVIFAGAQTVGASGFLTVYVAGIVLGNHRHRATQLINRFHDGLAWLSQIVMFLLLGLLVTPSDLLPTQIGRASCRERVCQYVSHSVVAV